MGQYFPAYSLRTFKIDEPSFRINPILPEDRTDTKLYQMFFVWFSANINILTSVITPEPTGA